MDISVQGSGEAVVIALHGIQGTSASWRPVAQVLEQSATFHMPNLRGRGGALRGRVSADYSLLAFAEDAAAAIRVVLQPGKCYVLAGWSMGVSVALQLLQHSSVPAPERLILLSGTSCISEVRWFAEEGEALQREIQAREQRLGLKQAADVEAVAMTWQALRNTDQRGLLAGIAIPTLVIHGSEDQDCPPSHGRSLAQGIANAQLLELQGIGHSVLSEATVQVAQAIEKFLSPISKAGAAV